MGDLDGDGKPEFVLSTPHDKLNTVLRLTPAP